MFRSTKIIKRPNTSIRFYHEVMPEPSTDYQREFFIRYIKTGKFLGMDKKLSEDQLTLEIAMTWDNSDSFIDYATDGNEHIENLRNELNSFILDNGLLDYHILEEIT